MNQKTGWGRDHMRKPFLFLALLACLGALAGCSVSTHEKDGKKNDVDVRTPFGSVKVQEGQTDVRDTGLSMYPGARAKKDFDQEHGANVNLSSSFLDLKLVALKFESDDSPDKVLAFYRKEMGKYGKVVDCAGGGFSLNFHHYDKDAEVTCDSHGSHEYKEELKVGTENNERVLDEKPSGKRSEYAVIYVRLGGGKETM